MKLNFFNWWIREDNILDGFLFRIRSGCRHSLSASQVDREPHRPILWKSCGMKLIISRIPLSSSSEFLGLVEKTFSLNRPPPQKKSRCGKWGLPTDHSCELRRPIHFPGNRASCRSPIIGRTSSLGVVRLPFGIGVIAEDEGTRSPTPSHSAPYVIVREDLLPPGSGSYDDLQTHL